MSQLETKLLGMAGVKIAEPCQYPPQEGGDVCSRGDVSSCGHCCDRSWPHLHSPSQLPGAALSRSSLL